MPTRSQSGRRMDAWARLGQRLKDREWRHYAYLLLFGKSVALLLLTLVAIPILTHFVGSPAMAEDPVFKGNDIVDPYLQ